MSEKQNKCTFIFGGKEYLVDKDLEESKGVINKKYSRADFEKEVIKYFSGKAKKIETEQIIDNDRTLAEKNGTLATGQNMNYVLKTDNKINKEIVSLFNQYLVFFGEEELKSFSVNLAAGIAKVDTEKLLVPISKAILNECEKVIIDSLQQRQENFNYMAANLAAQQGRSSLKPITPSSSASSLNSAGQRLANAENKEKSIEVGLAINSLTPSQKENQIGG